MSWQQRVEVRGNEEVVQSQDVWLTHRPGPGEQLILELQLVRGGRQAFSCFVDEAASTESRMVLRDLQETRISVG